jgi:hypothetical protein
MNINYSSLAFEGSLKEVKIFGDLVDDFTMRNSAGFS